MEEQQESWEDYAWRRQHELRYSAQMNRLYHHKRERFFAIMDRGGKALALIAGCAGASTLLATTDAKAIAGLLVAVVTLPGLVFSWTDKARLHAELAADYARLEAEIVGMAALGDADIRQLERRAIELGSKEPPGLSALIRICQNEIAMAEGQPEKTTPMPWHERALAQFFDFPMTQK